METGEEVGTVLHGTRGPNMNWQQIYGKGLRPRQLFSGNQGGKRSAQSTPTLTGAGNTPEEQMRSVYVTTATARATQALQAAEGANTLDMPPDQVAQHVQTAATAVDNVAAVQALAAAGAVRAQAGKSSGSGRVSVAQLGKGKPVRRPPCPLRCKRQGCHQGQRCCKRR